MSVSEYELTGVTTTSPDAVHHPSHYTQGDVECIDALRSALSSEQFTGYLAGNAIKYLWRFRHKNGVEDLRKARWYLDRLITGIEEE